ncbi:MAG: EamA family transporter [Proteobacteria bacterium]|nr:EamA family transporter [Pseudomonadota bacterium]
MLKGYIFIILAAVCWGFIGIFSSLAFAEGLGPMEVAFWRALIAWGFFGSQAIMRKETHLVKKDILLLAVFALLGISLFYISYQYAVKTGGAAFASVLLYTAPAWVVICSYFIYKEKLTANKILAVLLVITGVFLISKTGGNSNSATTLGFVAILSGLMSGFCYSLYYTIGKYFSSRYSSANLFLYVLPIGALGILPFVEFAHKSPVAWASLFAVSLVSTFIANHCYYLGLKYLEAGKASIVATIEPVVAAVAAYIILGEYFTSLGYIGAAMIISAVILTIYKK